MRILGGTTVSDSGRPESDTSPNLLAPFQEQHGPGYAVRASQESKHATMKISSSLEQLEKVAQPYQMPEDASRELAA